MSSSSIASGLLLATLVVSAGQPIVRADSKPSNAPMFERDVQPLLQGKCIRCHADKPRRGDLDLRSAASLLQGGESGPVVVPGKPEQSLLYEKVHQGLMPPNGKDRLKEVEIATIRRWIEAGAATTTTPSTSITQHDILPILLLRCTVCHGARQREGGLDLRSRAALLRGGKSGPAIVPGLPEESLLIRKLRAKQMPPLQRIVEVSIKPIEPAEVERLSQWIAAGAPEATVEPDVATTEPDPLVTDKDRDFWAFRKPVRPEVPYRPGVLHPVDAFLLQRLEQRGLTFAPMVDRSTLLRRVTLDLIGLPPTPDEVDAFLADTSPDTYERVVERLLASPRYGERWGRHWLDVAGYADSEGKREQDLARPNAWRFRDYVIRSFNSDKPYDRFLLEQLAGDELTDYENLKATTPEVYDNLVATGFLRMAPDPTWFNLTNFVPDRLEVIADEIDVLGSAVMGLTLKCARCHSHKFDPIPHRDYYRLVAVFRGAFDEHDWMKPNWHTGLSKGQRSDRDLPHVPANERQRWEAGGRKEPAPSIRALWDRGDPSPSYIYRRGDYLQPGRIVGPGVPSVLTDGRTPLVVAPPWPGAKQTGRRLAFARWLTRPDHPLTARVLVNRVWKHHFGAGLVRTLDNFGRAGARPSHPELLDWMAVEFVERSWSLKELHRLLVTSAAYRQSSRVTEEHRRLDPDNALLSRMPLQRMSAEQSYDSLLFLSGKLDESAHGPPDPVTLRPDGLATPAATPRGWRRSVYVQQQRKIVATHLESFDFPQMNPNCVERRDSTVAPQALHLMNNAQVQQLAQSFAQRVRQGAGDEAAHQVQYVYLAALGRHPTAAEQTLGVEALTSLRTEWTKQRASDPAEQALTTYCHALVNSAAFLYID